MTKGLTDLFIVDVESGSVRQLTSDAFADLQPAWSPDGSRIAFVTDRFSSTIETLNMGSYRIALLDPQTGRIEQAPAFTRGKNINPQWMPGSRSILFISDGDGIPNLYRLSLAEAAIFQVTSVATGLSGITNTSPALSVASRAGLAAFSVYDGGATRTIRDRPTALGRRESTPATCEASSPRRLQRFRRSIAGPAMCKRCQQTRPLAFRRHSSTRPPNTDRGFYEYGWTTDD